MSDQKIRILHVLGSLGIGGTERQQAELLKRLPPERIEQLVATMQASGPFLGEIEARGVEVIKFGFTSFYNRAAVRNCRSLARIIKDRRIQIVHCHDFYSNIFGTAAAKLARERVRVITSRRDLAGMYSSSQRVIQRVAQVFSTAIVANSEAVKQMLVEREYFPERKVQRIYNCIDTERFRPCEPNRELARSLGLAGDAPLIGVVASLHPWKGHRMFIRAAGIVHRARPDVRFLIVGGGSELAALQALARDVGVSEAVVFAGARKDVPELLALMSIFALSSPSEGLPNAVLEAMACARPVVATRAGGTAEVVDHGNTGYLVPVGEHAALAEKLLVMLADPARAEEMGSRGRQRALAEFSGKRLVESVTQLYEALLA